MQTRRLKKSSSFHVQVSATPIKVEEKGFCLLTLEDVTELYELRGIIPICSVCKKVRSDKAYWEGVEGYLIRHAGMKFSHGICFDCRKKLYPELE